jgi:hypothetical protein
MKSRIAAFAFVMVLAAGCSNDPTSPNPSPQFNASPPTGAGNGAGSSAQCTGPQADRPASCQSQGGSGDQP